MGSFFFATQRQGGKRRAAPEQKGLLLFGLNCQGMAPFGFGRRKNGGKNCSAHRYRDPVISPGPASWKGTTENSQFSPVEPQQLPHAPLGSVGGETQGARARRGEKAVERQGEPLAIGEELARPGMVVQPHPQACCGGSHGAVPPRHLERLRRLTEGVPVAATRGASRPSSRDSSSNRAAPPASRCRDSAGSPAAAPGTAATASSSPPNRSSRPRLVRSSASGSKRGSPRRRSNVTSRRSAFVREAPRTRLGFRKAARAVD